MHKNQMHKVKKHLVEKEIIHIFRQLLPTVANTFSDFISNNTDNFSLSYSQTILRTFLDIKQYCHFQRVTGKQYYTLLQNLYQTILTFSESSFQIKL